MTIERKYIERGWTYSTTQGPQIRLVLDIYRDKCLKYRVMNGPKKGEEKAVTIKAFARWANHRLEKDGVA